MKYLSNKYWGALAISAAFFLQGCKKEAFVEANLDPATLYEVSPENQFLAASVQIPNDFEYFYDVYRKLNFWLQYSTPAVGNGLNFNLPDALFNYRYNNLYNNVGPKLQDAIQIINSLPEEQRVSYMQIQNIAQIVKAYYTFYASDINGSIPYSEAFMARYGGSLTPVYDPQGVLFEQLDDDLRQAVANLTSVSSVPQVNLGNNDPFFYGNVEKWVKTANALRLRIASRFMKRDEAKLRSIVSEVLANNLQMVSIADSWELHTGPTYAMSDGNWNPTSFIAAKPIVDFMRDKADPRLRIFYTSNTQGAYVGGFTSPDDALRPENRDLYSTIDNFSQLQHRLFTPNYQSGTGAAFFPLITYAEYCFLRADLAARGYSADNPEEWYRLGVYGSLDYYNAHAGAPSPLEEGQWPVGVGIEAYTAMSQEEKDAYYAQDGVAYDAANGREQIAIQAYFDFYRNPFEAWSWWKRTGYPATSSSIFAWSRLFSNGTELTIPRRAAISYLPTSNLNYENQRAAIDAMMQDPGYGNSPGDAFGRVWWDAQ